MEDKIIKKSHEDKLVIKEVIYYIEQDIQWDKDGNIIECKHNRYLLEMTQKLQKLYEYS